MTKLVQTLALVVAFAVASTTVGRAQEKPAGAPAPSGVTPLKIQVVIARYQGEKKISSLPYTLSIASSHVPTRANLRMGSKIPVMMMAAPSVDGKPLKDIPTGGPVQYQDVGTNIDCFATSLGDGGHKLEITVEDTSVYPDDQPIAGGARGNPSFRSFRATDSMVLKDGATAQFTAATDKVSGEAVRVEVTLTVVK